MKTIEYSKYLEKLLKTDLKKAPLSETFALKLEYIFLCSDLSLYNFAILLNLNYSYFNDLLRGTKHISLNKIESICNALHITAVELFDFAPLYTMQAEKVFIKFPVFETLF